VECSLWKHFFAAVQSDVQHGQGGKSSLVDRTGPVGGEAAASLQSSCADLPHPLDSYTGAGWRPLGAPGGGAEHRFGIRWEECVHGAVLPGLPQASEIWLKSRARR